VEVDLKRSIVGSLASFGVALVLISTAGAASAQEAPSAPSSGDAAIGDPVYVERPAPRPDPANELGADVAPAASSPAPTPAPAPAPVSAPRSGGAVVAAPAPVAAQATPAPAASAPARATEVQGIQIERSAQPALATDPALAFTGADHNVGLTLLAVALLVLGAALVRFSRSPRTT
jgi:hypothetical protein